MKAQLFILSLLLSMALLPGKAFAQEDAEFRMEIGGGLGTCFYMGDANTKMYQNNRLAVTALWRYVFDHYNALKVQLSNGGMKGSHLLNNDVFPADAQATTAQRAGRYAFTGSVTDLNCIYELNFLPYGYYAGYMGYKRVTPFVQFGLGLTYSSKGKNLTTNIPVGFGVKYKATKRLNVSFDWAMHFATSDKLDGLVDPRGIRSGGFKNKDMYCTTLLTLTYSFAPICQACNKAD